MTIEKENMPYHYAFNYNGVIFRVWNLHKEDIDTVRIITTNHMVKFRSATELRATLEERFPYAEVEVEIKGI